MEQRSILAMTTIALAAVLLTSTGVVVRPKRNKVVDLTGTIYATKCRVF
jgi:hypothetical protein